MPEQTHTKSAELGVPVDQTAYDLSSEETIEYLAQKLVGYDIRA
jgi:hypothetical protein